MGRNAVKTTSGSGRTGRQERAAFMVSAAFISANIIVTSLVAVRPGVRRADHVLKTVVPLAVLAVACLLLPRLRPGIRAGVESFAGVLALIWAGLAIADAALTGFRAFHITGFLLVPTGAVLLWLAGTTLMRSRRPGRLRYLRRAAWVILALLAAYWVVLPIGMAGHAATGLRHRSRPWQAEWTTRK